MTPFSYFYHWTHKDNVGSILACGLDPEYAESKLPVIWFCEADRTAWALKHIAERHDWNPDEMVLLRFPTDKVPYAHTAYKGVFTTTRVIRIGARCGVKEGVIGQWVAAVTIRRNMGNSVQKRHNTDRPNPPASS